MINQVRFFVITLIVISCTGGEKKASSAEGPSINKEKVSQELVELTQRLWEIGYVNKDVNLVSELLHQEFKLVDDEGSVFTKEQELSYVADYGDLYGGFSYEIENIDVFENGIAIVRSDCRFAGSDSEGDFVTTYLQSLAFAQIDGVWKLVYSQVSGVKEERL